MNVDYNSWHCRLFRFHQRMKYGWEPSTWQGTNLCPYMRTVMFYWWLRWLFIDGKIETKRFRIPVPLILALLVFFFGPGFAGMVSYNLKCVLVGLDFIAVMILLIAGTVTVLSLLKNKVRDSKFHDAVLEPAAEATSGFFHLLGNYIHSFHNQICPHIDFVEETEINPNYPTTPNHGGGDEPSHPNAADLGCG